MTPTAFERLFTIACNQIPCDEEQRDGLRLAIQAGMNDVRSPAREITHNDVDQLERKLVEIRAQSSWSLADAFIVSIEFARHVLGWDPFHLPTVRRWGTPECYLTLRNAFGAIAIAWQIRTRPHAMILTIERYKRCRAGL